MIIKPPIMQKFLKICLIVTIALAGGASFALAAWQNPPPTAPNCSGAEIGCFRPINVGADNQVKQGPLGFGNEVWVDKLIRIAGLTSVSQFLVGPVESVPTPGVAFDVDGSLRVRGGTPAVGKILVALDSEGSAAWSSTAGAPDLTFTVRRATETITSDQPIVVAPNTTLVLEWRSGTATRCQAAGAWSGILPITGSVYVTPQFSSNFLLTCVNSASVTTKSVMVRVN